MKTILSVAVLCVLAAAKAESQEPAKIKVAILRLDRITNSGLNYEKLRILSSADKEAIEAIRKINAEMQSLQKDIIDAENETKLAEVGRRVQFLTQKMNMLRQRFMYNPTDMQTLVRSFVTDNYKNNYQLILQQDGNYPEYRFVWKNNVEINDITDEVVDKLKERLGQVADWPSNSYPAPCYAPYPSSVAPAVSMPRPVDAPAPRFVPPAPTAPPATVTPPAPLR